MDKLIRVIDEDTSELDGYLKKGYKIKNLFPCSSNLSTVDMICYVAITKED